jgi:phosphoribosyl 1,2-cyclic phosphodiesterase
LSFTGVIVTLAPLEKSAKNIIFCSLSSGSSGNCYYLGNGSQGILIDAGISAGSIRKFLKSLDIPMESVMGVLITHNHIDHIKGLEVLTRKKHFPVFTTKKIWESILTPQKSIPRDSVREISLQEKFHLAGFDIQAFPVSHDAPETIGFHVCAGEKKITIATDLGHICETAAHYIRSANLLVIESNYDEQMLMEGKYPYFLKKRISSDHGHLGNHQTSTFLSEMIRENLNYICLAHLSRNNNTPELAIQTLFQALADKSIVLNGKPEISILKHNMPTEAIRF